MANDVEFATGHATAGSSRKSVAGRHRPKCSSKVELAERLRPPKLAERRRKAEGIPIMLWTTAMGFAKRSSQPTICCLADSLICPTGKSVTRLSFACPAPFAKIFLFFRTPNQNYMIRRPVPQRGDTRSSRPRGGMRWTPMVQLTRALEADGEDVWS